MPGSLVLIGRDGREVEVPVEQAGQLLDSGFRVRTSADTAARIGAEAREEDNSGIADKAAAAALGVARGATVGLSDAGIAALGGADKVNALRDVNPTISTVGEIGGAIATAIPTGGESLAAKLPGAAVARLGARVAEAGEGASALTKIGRAAAGAATEGALYGAGSGVSELALSDDPVTIERAASVLSSNALYGAAIGGAAGTAGKALELGLGKAARAMDEYAATKAATADGASAVAEDLAGLDTKQLRVARDAELETIEKTRVTERQSVADDLAALRSEQEQQKLWLATKGAEEREVRKIGKLSLDADRQVDRLLSNPKDLAKRPEAALSALRKQEHALELMAKSDEAIRATFTADTSGARAAALDAVPAALEKNRALQAKIEAVTAKPASQRLTQIDDAMSALQSGAKEKSTAEQMLQGSVFGAVTHAVGSVVGGPLGMVAPFVGAKAAKFVTEKVFGRLGTATSEAAARTARAVSTFLDVSSKGARATPVVATRVLSSVTFAPSQERASGKSSPKRTPKSPVLADVFKQRSEELRSQTAYAPDGTVVMRPEARAQVAERLKPIAAAHPVLADRIETVAARRVEFLASKLPRRPDLVTMPTGPDRWQPSDMEMRTFARYVAAVEDPGGVEERLAHGTITPEDVEAMQAVYPERMAAVRMEIIGRLGELRATLPYERRLSLSMFTGVPVDPAMHPQILAALQQSFAAEEGSEGGTQAPAAAPQFGSVKAEPATPAQQREGANQ